MSTPSLRGGKTRSSTGPQEGPNREENTSTFGHPDDGHSDFGRSADDRRRDGEVRTRSGSELHVRHPGADHRPLEDAGRMHGG